MSKDAQSRSHFNKTLKRSEVYGKFLEKKIAKPKTKQGMNAGKTLGEEEEVDKQVPRTLDNVGETQATLVTERYSEIKTKVSLRPTWMENEHPKF